MRDRGVDRGGRVGWRTAAPTPKPWRPSSRASFEALIATIKPLRLSGGTMRLLPPYLPPWLPRTAPKKMGLVAARTKLWRPGDPK